MVTLSSSKKSVWEKSLFRYTVILGLMSLVLVVSKFVSKKYLVQESIEETNFFTTLPNSKISALYKEDSQKNFKVMGLHELIGEKEPELLIVHLWGTWCVPCLDEIPKLIKFTKQFEESKSNVKFVLLAVKDERKKLDKFVKNLVEFDLMPKFVKFYLGESDDILYHFNATKVPETFVFNGEKELLTKWTGAQDWSNKYYFSKLRGYL